jgi:hypothetical protein
MMMVSFVSKDNEGNQNLLAENRQYARIKKPVGGKPTGFSGVVDNSALFDFDRAFPAVDVALAGSGHGQLGLIHILVDG